MLKIWTAADPALITKTFGASLKTFRPNVPEHKFLPWANDGTAPDAGPDDVILVAGKRPLEDLQAHGFAAKNRTVTSLRETPLKAKGGGWYLVTFDPGVIQSEFDKKEVMDWDLRLAVRLMLTQSLEPQVGDYKWVASYADMIAWIEAKFAATGKPVDVSMDTETMGLYPWYPEKDFVSISFTARHNTAEMLYLGPQTAPIELNHTTPLLEQITWLLTSPKVRIRMANGKFDLMWIAEKWGLECTNFKFDTLLVGTLLDENRNNSLNLHAKVFTPLGGYDDHFNKTVDKARMEQVSPEKLRVYQGGDTDSCQQVADILRDQLAQDHELTRFYITVLHPAARAFEKVERRGVLIDQQKFHVLRDDLKKVIKESQTKQLEILPAKMRIKYRDRIDKQLKDGKNPMLPSILNEFFFTPHGLNLKPKELTEKTKEPKLTKSHLKQFAGASPEAAAMIAAMTEGDSAAKTLSTFVEGFLKHLRPDGRFHPSYMLFHGGFNDDEDEESGTVTGRLSCKEPAFQTLPKKTKWAKRIRECYPAPPGKFVIMIDYSQGELKVVACLAPEKTMIQAYLDGLDLHAVTGAKLAQVDLNEFLSWKDSTDDALAVLFDKNRGNAKPANFGLLYGMGAEGFQAYAWANYGIRLTLEEATQMRNAFFELYPGLLGFHDRQREIVRIHEEVRSPLGRLRHLPMIRSWDKAVKSKAERQAINCLSADTEILTPEGWKTVDTLRVGDAAFSVDPATACVEACPVEAINQGEVDGRMWSLEHNSVSALATPNHRWLVASSGKTKFKTCEELRSNGHDKIWIGTEGFMSVSTTWTDDEVELLGWILTDGHYKRQLSPKTGAEWGAGRVGVTQSKKVWMTEIAELFERLGPHSHQVRKTGQNVWEITCDASHRIRREMPGKTLTAAVLMSMSHRQRQALFVTMLKGDGCWDSQAGRWRKFVAGTKARADAFLMLCALIGQPARAVARDMSKYTPTLKTGQKPKMGIIWQVELVVNHRAQPQYGSDWIHWKGRVWCPTLKYGTWIAKRKGKVFVTGNSPIQSCLSDMMLWAIARIEQEFPNGEIEVVGMIHDALVAYVDADKLQYLAGQVVQLMSNLPLHEVGWQPQLKFTVDAEAGPDLANMKKLKFAA